MKKLILTITATVGVSMAGYSQGNVAFNDESTYGEGYVVLDSNGHLSSSTANYVAASDFTVQVYALAGNVTNTIPCATPAA